jgi:hypothetical protein
VDNNSKSYKSYEEEGGDENGDTYYWYVYEKNNYKGDYVCVDPGDKGDFDSDFVKKASSAKVTNDPCEEEG